MTWVWRDQPAGYRRRNRRRNRRNYGATYDRPDYGLYANGYGTDDEEYSPSDYADRRNGRYQANRNGGDDSFDGFYDRQGRRINLTIQSPRDMLPPMVSRDDDTFAPIRRRARF